MSDFRFTDVGDWERELQFQDVFGEWFSLELPTLD
jgi:hypothetical protein